MNTPNNKRRRESRSRIESCFVQLLQRKDLDEISVTEICKSAEINRTTFYANYVDIYDLAEAVQKRLEEEVMDLYQEEREKQTSSFDFLRLFRHIYENPLFYKTYFKLNSSGKLRIIGYDVKAAAARFDNRNIEYHIEFFGHGLNAVIRRWLESDCRETPEEINAILIEEYSRFDPDAKKP